MGAWIFRVFGKRPDPINHPYATATTPDAIIAETIINSMARNFGEWKKVDRAVERWEAGGGHPFNTGYQWALIGATPKSDIRLEWEDYGSSPHDFEVNGTPLAHAEGVRIVKAYNKLKAALDAAKAAEARAKRAMEENEKKWNLAETLLGMVRTPEGALVPAQPAE